MNYKMMFYPAYLTFNTFSCSTFAAETVKKSLPNIVLIVADDMGYSDLGCFGSSISTPVLDGLASNGIRFTNFTNCAKCGPSRTTLMSGRYHTEVPYKNAHNVISIPEALSLGGYQNFMVGKWHAFDTPNQRGFERFFGILNGACNFYTGMWKGNDIKVAGGGELVMQLDDEQYKPEPGFYTTTAFTDYAVKFIDERDQSKPFFLYTAYNAPHYPLQAPESEVKKYRGTFKDGWQALRQKRFERMKQQGIVAKDAQLSEPEPDTIAWDSLTDAEKDNQDLRMATFAAMIDMLDRGVGKIVQKLKDGGLYDNTLILFLSDNGACPFDRTTTATLDNDYKPWDPRSFYCYGPEWANACNTPYRKYKQNQNEGGISTPMIAHWPKGIDNPGRFDRERAHLVDLHATFCDLAGVTYPAEFKGNAIAPARGLSLAKAFTAEKRPVHDELFYQFGGKYSALTQGYWKLVDKRYLYNLENDRIESNDLSNAYPEKFDDMKKRWIELSKTYNDN